MIVEISADGGTTWGAVWSKDSSDPSAASWTDSGEISLAGFVGQSIIIRFTFNSIDGAYNNYKGWFIDDVKVEIGSGPEPPPAIFFDDMENGIGGWTATGL